MIPVAASKSRYSSPADLAPGVDLRERRPPNDKTHRASTATKRVPERGRERGSMLADFANAAQRLQASEIDAPTFAAFYFLRWLITRYGDASASRKRKSDPRPDVAAWWAELTAAHASPRRERLLTILERYQFRGVSANVSTALCRWLHGGWRLELRDDVPSPRDVLRAQARGIRPVTAITAAPRLWQPVLRHADAFAFFVHDLEHAYKFFHSPPLHAGQRAFFAALETALDRGVFARYSGDSMFVEKFHYAMSDMNTHPEHSRQYLRAILVEFHVRGEGKPASAPISPPAEHDIDAVMQHVAISA